MVKTLVESNNLLGAQKLILREVEQQMGGAAKAGRGYVERADYSVEQCIRRYEKSNW